MRRTTLLRNLIPALIVALVLGASFVLSASAKQASHDEGNRCGYGYGQTDNDESDNNNDNNADNNSDQGNNKTQAGADNDKACNEDESDNDEHGGDQGGDRDHGKGPADRDSRT